MSQFSIIPKLSRLSMRVCVLNSVDTTLVPLLACKTCSRGYTKHAGTPGIGVGKGGGAGGSIKEAGGGLGRYATAQEESYFVAKSKAELTKIKKEMKDKPELKDSPDLKKEK